MQIAIDTSTDIASIALVRDNEIMAELTWQCNQKHSTQLLPNLSLLLKQTETSLKIADCIIVAKGPGSFNGIRVGISTAKGLAFSLGIPIIGISTLEVEAYQHAVMGLPVCPIYNAGRGEIATATYIKKSNNWLQLVPEHISTVDTLCSQINTRTIFCGEYVLQISSQLKEQLKRKAVILSYTTSLRRAGFLAELGLQRIKSGDFDNPVTLQPLYLRAPAITKSKKVH